MARAILAKAVFDVPTTRALVERLRNDPALRRLCGWESVGAVPSEATLLRTFATSELARRLHEAVVERTLQDHLAGHVSRDSTAIPAREQSVCKSKPVKQKRKRGRLEWISWTALFSSDACLLPDYAAGTLTVRLHHPTTWGRGAQAAATTG